MEIQEEKNNFSEEEMGLIKEISDQLWSQLDSKSDKILTKKFIFDIYIALLISIPFSNIFDIFSKIDLNKEKSLQNLFDDLLNIKKVNFSSKNLLTKIKAKYEYYEKAYKIRSQIQNCEWNYHNLNKDIVQFLQARERIKIEFEFIQKNKIGNIQCNNCNTKWLNSETQLCPVCEKEDELSMYITLSNLFNVVGDLSDFYKYLDPFTKTKLFDNWKYILETLRHKKHIKMCSIYNKKIKETGALQYKKIIKTGNEDKIDKYLFEFNKKYNTALINNNEEIDLREAVNTNTDEFMTDFNKVYFPLCSKIKFGKRINLSKFKPNMPELEWIYAENCHLKTISLDPDFFPKLKRLIINDNDITTYNDIKDLSKIKNLKIIDVTGNPIERSIELWKLTDNMPEIEIRYDYRLRLVNRNRIDEESDPEIKKILAEIPPESESEPSS